MKTTSNTKKAVAAGTLLLAGFGGGAAVMTAGSASATDSATPSAGSSASGAVDQSQPQRSDEQLLTGDTLTKVTAAVQAAYPDATIERVESDSDGVYEGHVVTTDGNELIVQVGADFSVTGTQSGHGPGDHDGDGPDAAASPAG